MECNYGIVGNVKRLEIGENMLLVEWDACLSSSILQQPADIGIGGAQVALPKTLNMNPAKEINRRNSQNLVPVLCPFTIVDLDLAKTFTARG